MRSLVLLLLLALPACGLDYEDGRVFLPGPDAGGTLAAAAAAPSTPPPVAAAAASPAVGEPQYPLAAARAEDRCTATDRVLYGPAPLLIPPAKSSADPVLLTFPLNVRPEHLELVRVRLSVPYAIQGGEVFGDDVPRVGDKPGLWGFVGKTEAGDVRLMIARNIPPESKPWLAHVVVTEPAFQGDCK